MDSLPGSVLETEDGVYVAEDSRVAFFPRGDSASVELEIRSATLLSDARGNVWVASSGGLFVLPHPKALSRNPALATPQGPDGVVALLHHDDRLVTFGNEGVQELRDRQWIPMHAAR
ncbi:MAG: hypothetical protein FJX76_00190 [Armatimonadetes bacterium]|nr:hypothetical protein [Armatimonadota bacterium]